MRTLSPRHTRWVFEEKKIKNKKRVKMLFRQWNMKNKVMLSRYLSPRCSFSIKQLKLFLTAEEELKHLNARKMQKGIIYSH